MLCVHSTCPTRSGFRQYHHVSTREDPYPCRVYSMLIVCLRSVHGETKRSLGEIAACARRLRGDVWGCHSSHALIMPYQFVTVLAMLCVHSTCPTRSGFRQYHHVSTREDPYPCRVYSMLIVCLRSVHGETKRSLGEIAACARRLRGDVWG